MKTAAIIVAAGSGSRMGAGPPKVFLRLGGRSILEHAVRAFHGHPRIGQVVVAVSDVPRAREALGGLADGVRLVAGGERRQDSVRRALDSVAGAEAILVHDAARPLVEAALIEAIVEAVLRYGAALPVIPVAATVKRAAADGFVAETVDRVPLRLAQTPQGFRTALLRRAFAEAERNGIEATDDAALVERLGSRVRLVEGSPRNVKITVPADLLIAEALLAGDERRGA